MNSVSIDDYSSRPIFLHAVNKELHRAVGQEINHTELLKSIRIFSLICGQNLFCNTSQIFAALHDDHEAIQEIFELQKIGLFTPHSDYGSVEEFLDSRASKFSHAKDFNEGFFGGHSTELLSLPLSTMGMEIQTTNYIENQLFGLIEDRKNLLSSSLDQNDLRLIKESEDWVADTLQNRYEKGLTSEVFEQSSKADRRPTAVGAVRRGLSQAYIGSYTEPFNALCIWGYRGLNRFDRRELLTGLNLRFAQSILSALGIDQVLESQPRYGQIERLTSVSTEELALLQHRYYELASYLDQNSVVNAGYYDRNLSVRQSIQRVLSTRTLKLHSTPHSFRDRLLKAAVAIEKTTKFLSDGQSKVSEPRLHAIYPNPALAQASASKKHIKSEVISSEEIKPSTGNFEFGSYNKLLWLVPLIVFPPTFLSFWLMMDFGWKQSVVWSVCLTIAVFSILLIFHPKYWYRKIAVSGLALIGFGGISLSLNLEGVEFFGESYLKLEDSHSVAIMIIGFLVFLVGVIADFLQHTVFRFSRK